MKKAIKKIFRIWFEVAKTALVTHALAWTALAVHILLEISGNREKAIQLLGIQLGQIYTFLSHVILHNMWWHLGENLLALEIAGPFIEKSIGKWYYLISILVITLVGASFSVVFALDDWAAGNNPVGMSISTRALMLAGIYLVIQSFLSRNRKWIIRLALKAKRQGLSWAAVAVMAAIATIFIWMESSVEVGAIEIAHGTGAVMGVGLAIIIAVKETLRDEEQGETVGDNQKENDRKEVEISGADFLGDIVEDERE